MGNKDKSAEAQGIQEMPQSSVVKAIVAGEAQDTGGVVGKRLLSFIERVERIEEEKAGLVDDIKDVMTEAKGVGFDTKIIRRIIRERKMDVESRREEAELMDLYKSAIGME